MSPEETRKSIEALALLLIPSGQGRAEVGVMRRPTAKGYEYRWEVEVDDRFVGGGDWDEDVDDAMEHLRHALISTLRQRAVRLDELLGVESPAAELAATLAGDAGAWVPWPTSPGLWWCRGPRGLVYLCSAAAERGEIYLRTVWSPDGPRNALDRPCKGWTFCAQAVPRG